MVKKKNAPRTSFGAHKISHHALKKTNPHRLNAEQKMGLGINTTSIGLLYPKTITYQQIHVTSIQIIAKLYLHIHTKLSDLRV